MAKLTEEQIRNLDALITYLGQLPLPELLATAPKLLIQTPLSANGKVFHRQHLAGAIAVHKIGYYTQALISFDRERLTLGQQAQHRLETARNLFPSSPSEAVTSFDDSIMASSYQEITFHFWAICVTRISRLLKMAQKHTGYRLPMEDRDWLESYRPLRDYFEHLEDEVPGKRGRTDVVRESHDDEEWRVTVGFASDEAGRIVLNGQTIDVTTEGLNHVLAVVERSFDGFREGILARIREHFTDHPEQTPHPDDVQPVPLVSISLDQVRQRT